MIEYIRYFIIIFIILAIIAIIVLLMKKFKAKKKKFSPQDRGRSIDRPVPGFTGNHSVIGDYKKAAKIGDGGMSTIYLAMPTHGNTKKKVVLKVLENEYRNDTQAGAKFLEEGAILKEINEKYPSSPVVKVIESGRDPLTELNFIAMEYIDGDSLKDILESKSELTLKEKLSIVRDAAQALKDCHELRICHCDIAPGNIMVHRSRKNARLIDFSIAVKESTNPPNAKESGYGNPYYMSPEQGSKGIITRKSDIYSLGAVLFHLLEGVAPHKAGEHYATIMEMSKSGRIPPITKPVPPALKDFIYRMMAMDPGQRPEAQEVIQTMKGFL